MFRRTRARTVVLALLTAAVAATSLASVLPSSASAMGTMKAQESTRQIPERICRPLTTCSAAWLKTVEASVPLSRGESVDPGSKVVMDLWGDDAFSDDHLATVNVPLRQPTTLGARVCDESKTRGLDNLFYRSGDTLVIRGCFYSAKKYGNFNEDRNGFLDDGDELLLKIKVVNSRGKTLASASTRSYGYY